MRIILAGVFVLLSSTAARADLRAYWNFDGYLDSPSQTVLAANAGSGTLTITGFPDADLKKDGGTTINQTTPADAGSNEAVQLKNSANNGDFLDLSFSMTGYQDLVLTYVTIRDDKGFNSNQWSYSTNGGTSFTPFGPVVNPVKSGSFSISSLVTRDFTGVGALANQASVILRYTFGGASDSGGTNDLDNIQLNATAIGAVVPEPPTLVLLVAGFFGMAVLRFRQQSLALRTAPVKTT